MTPSREVQRQERLYGKRTASPIPLILLMALLGTLFWIFMVREVLPEFGLTSLSRHTPIVTSRKDAEMNLELNPKEIIEQAAARLADEAYENVDAMEMLEAEISHRIDKFLSDRANALMEETLMNALEGIMTREIRPVNSWGEPAGKPIQLREEMQRRAQEFWCVKVDKDGKPSTYGGKPRHQHMYESIAKEAFAEAVKENVEEVIAGFRDALRKDAGQMLGEHIERFIKAPKRK